MFLLVIGLIIGFIGGGLAGVFTAALVMAGSRGDKTMANENGCEKCKYYDVEEANCGAFECYGIDCPKLPCEQWWVFIFGLGYEFGQNRGKAVKVFANSYGEAREKMFARYGNKWACQYSEEEWKEWEAHPYYETPEIVEVID